MAKDKPKVKEHNKNMSSTKDNVTNNPKALSGIWQDERFQHLVSDPRFKNIPKQQKKVKIDKRFQGMFTDDKFTVKYTIDKYGRKVNQSTAGDLKKYYELSSSADEKEEQEEAEEEKAKSSADEEDEERIEEEKAIVQQEEDFIENDALVSDGEDVPKTLKERLLDPHIDYARGEGRLLTDSSSDEESSEDDEDPELYLDHVWGELDNDAETTDESTRRLAVCNMDWDRIRAIDLMMLFSSFLPPGGSVLSVKIYPSEYGKQRMAEEELKGPPELVGLGKSINGEKTDPESSESEDDLVQEQDSDAEEGDDYHMEKLRQYQLNRLRYYYAVVECDAIGTADKIYRECDGIEYESSATRVDLRFIPDNTTFDDGEVTDVCTEMPNVGSYKPRQFTTTALQQAKVDLTWDETALERRELGDKLSTGHLEGVSDKDLRKIVAYSSEEEEEDNETEDSKTNDVNDDEVKPAEGYRKKKDIINKYKTLLAEITEKETKEKERKKYEMEFTWEVNDTKEDNNEDKQETQYVGDKSQLTPIEKVLQKRSEKNKKRKEERKKRKLLAKGIDPETIEHDSDIDSIPDGIDMNDPYFAEEFANNDFIDPHAKLKDTRKKQQKLLNEQHQEEEEKQIKELELLLDDDDELIDGERKNKQHFSLEKILKAEQQDTASGKRKRRKQLKKSKYSIEANSKPIEDNFQINLNDERFKAIFDTADFNIDPTHPRFKKTKGTAQLVQEQQKRRHNQSTITNPAKRPKEQVENNILIKSLKRKLQMKASK